MTVNGKKNYLGQQSIFVLDDVDPSECLQIRDNDFWVDVGVLRTDERSVLDEFGAGHRLRTRNVEVRLASDLVAFQRRAEATAEFASSGERANNSRLNVLQSTLRIFVHLKLAYFSIVGNVSYIPYRDVQCLEVPFLSSCWNLM